MSMSNARPTALGLLAGLPLLLGLPLPAAADDSEKKPTKTCVEVSTEAPYVPYGYNHIVVLQNTCEKPMHCQVSTDVNPKVQEVDVPAKKTVKVLTFQGSPARVFTPDVTCKAK